MDLTVDELRDVASEGRVIGSVPAAAPVVVVAELRRDSRALCVCVCVCLIPSAILSRAAMLASVLMLTPAGPSDQSSALCDLQSE